MGYVTETAQIESLALSLYIRSFLQQLVVLFEGNMKKVYYHNNDRHVLY